MRAAGRAFCTLLHIRRRPQSPHSGTESAGSLSGLQIDLPIFLTKASWASLSLGTGDVPRLLRGVWRAKSRPLFSRRPHCGGARETERSLKSEPQPKPATADAPLTHSSPPQGLSRVKLWLEALNWPREPRGDKR